MPIVDSDKPPEGKKEGDDADPLPPSPEVGDDKGNYPTTEADKELLKEATKVPPSGTPPLSAILPRAVSATGSASNPAPTGGSPRKVIAIPGIALLIPLVIIVAAAFMYGNMTATPAKPHMKIDNSKPKTEYNPDNGRPDPGADGLIGTTWALQGIADAQSSIVWITNYPDAARIPEALQKRQNTSGVSILIIVGSNCDLDTTKTALQMNLPVYRSPIKLENPQSLLLIDKTLVVDAARQRTAWRSFEPSIAASVYEWINKTILPNCEPLHIENH